MNWFGTFIALVILGTALYSFKPHRESTFEDMLWGFYCFTIALLIWTALP